MHFSRIKNSASSHSKSFGQRWDKVRSWHTPTVPKMEKKKHASSHWRTARMISPCTSGSAAAGLAAVAASGALVAAQTGRSLPKILGFAELNGQMPIHPFSTLLHGLWRCRRRHGVKISKEKV